MKSNKIKEKIVKFNICCTLFIIILFASYQTVATELNWVKIHPSPSPPSQKPWKLMYHPPSQDIILFGGKSSKGNYQALWSYNREETSWVEVEVSEWETFPDMGWGMTYDSKNDVFITFGGGGMDGSLPVQTWTFNYSNKIWTNMSPSISPPPRIMSSLACDTQSEKVIMFGGIDQFIGTNVLYHDTWTYDYLSNTWTNVTPSINPEGRGRANMVYDSANDKVLLFGGFTEKPGDYIIGGLKQDMWVFDSETNNWTELVSPVKPSARAYHSMVYNSDINQTVIFGGDIDNLTPTSDTWLFDYLTNTWSELVVDPKPPARWQAGMVFDPITDQIILFGGQTAENLVCTDDTWILGSKLMPSSITTTTETSGNGTFGFRFGIILILIGFSIYNKNRRKKYSKI